MTDEIARQVLWKHIEGIASGQFAAMPQVHQMAELCLELRAELEIASERARVSIRELYDTNHKCYEEMRDCIDAEAAVVCRGSLP